MTHSQAADGIARSFVHAQAASGLDPLGLFLLTMVWGWGSDGRGASNTRRMLEQQDASERLCAIVEATRRGGAAAGWRALINTDAIKYLKVSFGTKLLYFAGYVKHHRPRPLILDERVRWSLYDLARGTVPPPGRRVTEAHYMRYLELAEIWAADSSWGQEPHVVEYGLYKLNGVYPVDVVIPALS